MGTTFVDPAVLRFAARRLDEAADLLDTAVRTHLNGLQLPAQRTAVGAALGTLVDDVVSWQRAEREYAWAVRACADRYADSDRHDAEALR